MTTPTLDRATVAGLAGQVRGPVLLPGDDGLEAEVSAFNLAITHHPAVVVGATCAEDVSAAVRWAAARGLPVAVQATGHGAVVPADGALMITTRRMDGVTVDPVARTATIQAGAKWARVIEAATPHGLASLNGSSSDVGAIGYTLGGGLPVLGRAFGFAADHVRSLEVVTADGAVRHVDPDHEPDLFFALRGGKGSFGVVTEMVIDLVPVARLYGGAVLFPGDAAPAVLHAYREWVTTLTEQTCSSFALMRMPDLPIVPEPLRGQFFVSLRFAHLGSAEEGAAVLAPMRAAAPVMMDMVDEMPYAAVDAIHQDPTDPVPVWESGVVLRELSAAAVDTLLAAAGPGVELPLVAVEVRHLGGALARRPEHPNAVGGRDGAFSVWALGALMPGIAEVVPAAGHGLLAAMAPYTADGGLMNFLGDRTAAEDVASLWPAEVHERLLGIKRAVDPDNLFCLGHALVARPAVVPAQAQPPGR